MKTTTASVRRQRGLTLLEVMITIVIAAIVLAIAVPSFNEIITRSRVATATNSLLAAINLTRSEATKRATRVSMCPSSDGQNCTANADWTVGWIVFSDHLTDATQPPARDTGEVVIAEYPALPPGVTASGLSYVSFVTDGTSRLTNGGFLAGNIQICANNPPNADRRLVINSVGRVRTEAFTCP